MMAGALDVEVSTDSEAAGKSRLVLLQDFPRPVPRRAAGGC